MAHLHPWPSLWGYCSCKSCYMIQRRVPAIPMPGTPGPSIAVEASRWHLFIWDTHDGPSWPTLWHSLLYWLSLTHGNFLTEVFAQQQPPQLAAPTLPHLLGSSFFTLGNAACLAHKRTAPHHPKKKKIPTSHIRAPPQPLTRMWESSLPRWLPDFAHTWHARASAALSLRRASSAWSARPWTTLSMCLVLSCLAGKHLAWQPHSPRAEIRMTRIYSPTELKGEPLACLAHSSQPNSAIGAGLSFRNSHSQPLVTRPACARLGLLPRATLQKNGETQPLCCYDSSNLHRFMGHNRSVT